MDDDPHFENGNRTGVDGVEGGMVGTVAKGQKKKKSKSVVIVPPTEGDAKKMRNVGEDVSEQKESQQPKVVRRKRSKQLREQGNGPAAQESKEAVADAVTNASSVFGDATTTTRTKRKPQKINSMDKAEAKMQTGKGADKDKDDQETRTLPSGLVISVSRSPGAHPTSLAGNTLPVESAKGKNKEQARVIPKPVKADIVGAIRRDAKQVSTGPQSSAAGKAEENRVIPQPITQNAPDTWGGKSGKKDRGHSRQNGAVVDRINRVMKELATLSLSDQSASTSARKAKKESEGEEEVVDFEQMMHPTPSGKSLHSRHEVRKAKSFAAFGKPEGYGDYQMERTQRHQDSHSRAPRTPRSGRRGSADHRSHHLSEYAGSQSRQYQAKSVKESTPTPVGSWRQQHQNQDHRPASAPVGQHTPQQGRGQSGGDWRQRRPGSGTGDSSAQLGKRLWTPARDTANGTPNTPRTPRALLYEEYMSFEEVKDGLANGTLKQGSVRISRRNRNDAYITADDSGQDIYISGTKYRNRAFEGDVVAVRLLEGTELMMSMEGERFRREKKKQQSDARQAKCDVTDTAMEDDEDEEDEEDEPVNPVEKAAEEKRIYGKVVAVIERGQNRSFAGTLQGSVGDRRRNWNGSGTSASGNGNRDRAPTIIWFKPTDKRVPLIAIPVEHVPKEFLQDPVAYSRILFKATSGKWPATSQHPFGVVTGTLGQMGEIPIETEALLTDAGIDWNEFSDEVLACLPEIPWKIPAEEYVKRRDLREERIFSIDPQTARDLDDAVSVKPLPDGTFEVGVHIADVSYFVPAGSALDKEARHRATTIYLVQKAIPMLPRTLCEDLCSLNPGVERLAFSVMWKMDARAQILETPWFGRSIIRSCAKLSYDHAQRLIENSDWSGLPEVELYGTTDIEDIKSDTLRLYEFSKMMRQRRFDQGALSMNSPKLWFAIDDYGNPVDTGVYELKDSNRLIEEFMLLANMAVAAKIAKHYPESALLRNHRPPKEKVMDEFITFAAQLGYSLDPSTSSTLQQSFNAIGEEKRTVLQQLCIKPMQRAKYFCTGKLEIPKWHHYALNVPLYTHFTSPIRRYCDVIVHRMLDVALAGQVEDLYESDEVMQIAKQCNDRKDASKTAQEASQRLFLCAYLARLCEQRRLHSGEKVLPGVVTEAVVYAIGTRSFDVLIDKYGLEKRVWIEDSIDLGEVIGCEEEKSEIKSLRVYWKKQEDGNGEPVAVNDLNGNRNDDASDADSTALNQANQNATPKRGSKPEKKTNASKRRTLDKESTVTQTIGIFQKLWVRIVPDMASSPPDLKVFAVYPGAEQAYHAQQMKAYGVEISCPAFNEDAE